EALEAETLAQKVSQESGLLDQQSVTLNAKLNFEASQLKMAAQQKLFNNKSGAVSQIDFEQTQLETKQFKQRWQLQQARFEKMQENLTAQNNARAARLNKMRKILERVQQQVAELAVRASIDSVVQALPLEPGQQISMGTNIAKLARKNSLIAELQIPEIQIRDVAIGQRVEIDTRNNKVDGVVTRIDPAVINGNVQVDVAFRQELPRDARPDLTVDGEIKIAEIDDALHVNRPLFAQSQSSSAVYKLDKNGEFAERVFVKLGKGSTNQIQVIEGLSAGDKIIISDPTSWETYQKIKLN
ncbi:MAG: HlyD family efflux transporter periplasmic adaptor subunit, partial [Kangiellaceae bacterium]|nr:HlyD family efflux transporter periplasmic adaptor subunit [Kangiellaceae bacterium]